MSGLPLRSLEDHAGKLGGLVTDGHFVQLARAEMSAAQAPALVLGALPEPVARRFYLEDTPGAVRCYALRNALLSTGGTIIHQGAILFTEALNQPEPFVRAVTEGLSGTALDRPVRDIAQRAVLLNGPGQNIFGHWLIDFLPRLFVLRQCGFDLAALTYIVSSDAPPWTFAMLADFGVRAHQILVHDEYGEYLRVEELIVPTNLRQRSRAHALLKAAAQDLVRLAERDATLPPSPVAARRLYVTRGAETDTRRLENREAIEALAVREGLTPVRPQSFPFLQQIALYREAEIIVGEYGSALHLSLFSRPGTVVCALRGSSHHPGWLQSGIGQALGQPVCYLLGDTPAEAVYQSMTIPPDVVSAGLRFCRLLADSRF